MGDQKTEVRNEWGDLSAYFSMNGQWRYEQEQCLMRTPAVLLQILDCKDRETLEHSIRVSRISIAIGEKMELDEKRMKQLYWGTLLHDVGKLVVEKEILNKTEKLSVQEWETLKGHASKGYELLSDSRQEEAVKEIVLLHHERFDGNGYPYKMKGLEIPLFARICAVADAYDAMTSQRCYKSAKDAQAAKAELKKCSGGQFDPEIVNVFLKVSN